MGKRKIKVLLDRTLLVWYPDDFGIYVDQNSKEDAKAIRDKLPLLFFKQLERFREREEFIEITSRGNISSDEHLRSNEDYLRIGKLLQKYLGDNYDVDIYFSSDKVWWDKIEDKIKYD